MPEPTAPAEAISACIIIPAYNAAATLPPLLERARAIGYPVIVVDDGSRDATAEIARSAGVQVLRHEVNQGKGAALLAGFRAALRAGYAYVLTMDADGQHDPADVPRFLDCARRHPEAGLIIGNRMAERARMPLARRWTNQLMSWYLSRRAGQRVPDTQCGFRLMRREFLERCALLATRFEIESELVLEAGRLRTMIASLPIRALYAAERSHIHPLRDAVRFLRMASAYRRRHHG